MFPRFARPHSGWRPHSDGYTAVYQKHFAYRHGESGDFLAGRPKTVEYTLWRSMINRCYNTKVQNYHYYGGRGIMVCPRWRHDYLAFLADVGRRPAPGLSLDRINNDGNYEPGNVRWATRSQQARNTSRYKKAASRQSLDTF